MANIRSCKTNTWMCSKKSAGNFGLNFSRASQMVVVELDSADQPLPEPNGDELAEPHDDVKRCRKTQSLNRHAGR